LLTVLTPLAHLLTPLLLSAATAAIMLTVAIWEAVSIGSRRSRSEATGA
jgi:hypothetical protein